VKIPIEFEDFDPQDPDIEFRKNRWDYWNILRKIREEYIADCIERQGPFDTDDFVRYMEQNYGIKMHIDYGKITDKFEITDEKLYTFLILKHT
jgi:hypothetical protein